MAYSFGLTGELLFGTAANPPAPGGTVTNVRDVTLTLSTVDADTTSRMSTLFESSKVLLLNAVLTFDMLVDEDDTDLAIAAIQTAWYTKAAMSFHAKNKNGGEGLLGNFNITSFTRNEPLRDVMTYSIEAKPNNELAEPTWA